MSTSQVQTALITGASHGLGLALARGLAHAGWNLIIDGRDPGTLETARAELAQITNVIAIAGDVTDPSHRRKLGLAIGEFGVLDALVNNASTLGPSPQPKLIDYPLNALQAVFQANLLAPLGVLQSVSKSIKPGGIVINISSDAAVEAYEGWGGYGASKAALELMSSVLAVENPDWRVYWVDPGDMRTQMHQDAFPEEDISDRPLPQVSVPGLIALLDSTRPSGRYQARSIKTSSVEPEAIFAI